MESEFTRLETFEETVQSINGAPSLRKIKIIIDGTDFSADAKAILYDIAKITIKIGKAVVAIGRRIFEIATSLMRKFPNLALGALVGLVIATVISGTLGTIALGPIAPFAGLAALLSKLVIVIGVGKGFLDDLRNNAAKADMDRVEAHFDGLKAGFARA